MTKKKGLGIGLDLIGKDLGNNIEMIKNSNKQYEEGIKQKAKEELKKELKTITLNQEEHIIEIENSQFDYEELDKGTAKFLKEKALEIHELGKVFYTQLGQHLCEAQKKLAGTKSRGTFLVWVESLGLKSSTVYRLIDRYNFMVSHSGKESLIENLPLGLSYEISKKKNIENHMDIIKKVFLGKIKSKKDFLNAIKMKLELPEPNKKSKWDYEYHNFHAKYTEKTALFKMELGRELTAEEKEEIEKFFVYVTGKLETENQTIDLS